MAPTPLRCKSLGAIASLHFFNVHFRPQTKSMSILLYNEQAHQKNQSGNRQQRYRRTPTVILTILAAVMTCVP